MFGTFSLAYHVYEFLRLGGVVYVGCYEYNWCCQMLNLFGLSAFPEKQPSHLITEFHQQLQVDELGTNLNLPHCTISNLGLPQAGFLIGQIKGEAAWGSSWQGQISNVPQSLDLSPCCMSPVECHQQTCLFQLWLSMPILPTRHWTGAFQTGYIKLGHFPCQSIGHHQVRIVIIIGITNALPLPDQD